MKIEFEKKRTKSNMMGQSPLLTLATNIEVIFSLSRNVLAISAVGDLEAMATSTPFSLKAFKMPLAWGYKDGISRFDLHSL